MAIIAHAARAKGLDRGRVGELLARLEAAPGGVEGRTSDALYSELLFALDEASGDPKLWFELGSRLTPTALGHVGQLLMTSATLRDALCLLERFYPMLRSATEMVLRRQGHGDAQGDCHLQVTTRYPHGSRAARMRLEAVASAARSTMHVLTGAPAPRLSFAFDYPPPHNAAVYTECLGGPVAFGQPHNRWSVPAVDLNRALPLHDASTHAVLLEQCERAFAAFTAEHPVRPLPEELALRIRRAPGMVLSLEQAARQLAMSPRTLSRRLASSGAGFDAIRTRERTAMAIRLLLHSELSIAEVAQRIGFDDASNFARAFARWQGVPPSRFRKLRREQDERSVSRT